MARVVDPSQGVDPANQELIGAAPRVQPNTRQNNTRNVREMRKRHDKFYVPPHEIPKGYSVEWKRKSVLGKPEDVEYNMDMSDAGWRYADPAVFKSLVPEGYTGKTIERGGMVLMIRPSQMTAEAKKFDREEALGQVKDKLQEIGMTGQGEAPRRVQAFSRTYDRPASRMVPEDDGGDYQEN